MKQHSIASAEKEVKGEIMATDVFVKILSERYSQKEMLLDIENVFDTLKSFGKRFSRFEEGNELWRLNHTEKIKVSKEMMDILQLTQKYYALTEGVFNPSILPILKKEGYVVGKQNRFSGSYHNKESKVYPLEVLKIDVENLEASKPLDMHLDFGGIGKGYAIDLVTFSLRSKYENFLVDAGGDIMAKGMDMENDYPYWAVEVEHPYDIEQSLCTLLLKDVSVATSGSNRRKWRTKHNEEKHHLIDPFLLESAQSDLLSVTVVSDTAVDADIWAKTFFILGFEKGLRLSEEKGKAALFFKKDGGEHYNSHIDVYVWK